MAKRQRNSFLTPLDVRVLESGKRFMLLNQFTYRWQGYAGGGTVRIRVPAKFETDFASIPKFARLIIPKLGRYNKAAVIHDYLYSRHSDSLSPHVTIIFTRFLADRIFLDGMADLGVQAWQRTLMYWAVRVGGFLAWRKR